MFIVMEECIPSKSALVLVLTDHACIPLGFGMAIKLEQAAKRDLVRTPAHTLAFNCANIMRSRALGSGAVSDGRCT